MNRKIGSTSRTIVLCVVISTLSFLASCTSGSSGSSSGSEDVSSSSELTTAKTEATSTLSTPEAVAQALSDKGLPCTGFVPKIVDPKENSTMTLAPEPPSVQGKCTTVNGEKINIAVFETRDGSDMAVAQIQTVYAMLMKAFGVKSVGIVRAGKDSRVMISISNDGSSTDLTPDQEALLKDVAKLLSGKFEKINF